MPDTLGHSVGPERWELLTRLAGNEVFYKSFFILSGYYHHYLLF